MSVADAASLGLRNVSVKSYPLKCSRAFNGNRAQEPGPAGLPKCLAITGWGGEPQRQSTAVQPAPRKEELRKPRVPLPPGGKCLFELFLLI